MRAAIEMLGKVSGHEVGGRACANQREEGAWEAVRANRQGLDTVKEVMGAICIGAAESKGVEKKSG